MHRSPAVAVRSSATAEDLPDLSFAGQQDTFLNVVGDAALLEAVVRCWSSLWTARAIAYRARNGIPQEGVALAVVVQAMVESEASGVLFTANPLTGKRTETVIDATLGLGEALVSGQVEPDHYVVDVATGRIVSKTLGAKALAIRGQAGGGTTTVAADAAAQQALPDAAILELARLGKRVEQELYAGQPQDIEWAWAEGRLFLLQSRAITSLYPLPDGMPAEPLQVLFSLNHVQGMLDPFTPLGQDAIIRAYVVLATLFGRRYTPATQREAVIAGERIYLNISPALRHSLGRKLVRGIFSAIEPGAGQAIASVLDDPRLAVERSGFSPAAAASLARFVSFEARRVALVMRQPDVRRTAALRLIDDFIAEMEARSRQTSSLAERLTLWQAIYDEFAARISPHLFPPIAAGMASFFQLRRLAQHALGSDQLALEVARGLPNNVTTEMDLALWTVAQVIQADPGVSGALRPGGRGYAGGRVRGQDVASARAGRVDGVYGALRHARPGRDRLGPAPVAREPGLRDADGGELPIASTTRRRRPMRCSDAGPMLPRRRSSAWLKPCPIRPRLRRRVSWPAACAPWPGCARRLSLPSSGSWVSCAR